MPRSLIRAASMDHEGAKRFAADCLDLGADRDGLAEAVSAVDWSLPDEIDRDVARTLGKIEGAITAFVEGSTSWIQAEAELRELAGLRRRASA